MGASGTHGNGGEGIGGSNGSAAVAVRHIWAVYTIVEFDEKATWRRIGSGFLNRDGSYNVYLEALPVNGKLHMRETDGTPLNLGRP